MAVLSQRLSSRAFASISKNIIAALSLAPQTWCVRLDGQRRDFSGNYPKRRLLAILFFRADEDSLRMNLTAKYRKIIRSFFALFLRFHTGLYSLKRTLPLRNYLYSQQLRILVISSTSDSYSMARKSQSVVIIKVWLRCARMSRPKCSFTVSSNCMID